MITREFDTIAAISTPLGEGAIGIVRLSGTDSFAIVQKIFKGKDLNKVASHTLNYGHIIDPLTGKVMDEVMVGAMKSPKTFTREDIIEINTHGGIAVTNEILQLAIREGLGWQNLVNLPNVLFKRSRRLDTGRGCDGYHPCQD